MASAIFDQSSGEFSIFVPDDGGIDRCVYEVSGYAGRGLGVNNPRMQAVRNTGPLPRGTYHLGSPQTHPRLGTLAFPLAPARGNRMFGRAGFFIHGDNRHLNRTASHGCIILSRTAREAVRDYGVRTLVVLTSRPQGEDLNSKHK